MRRRGRTDTNQTRIVAFLRSAGASVQVLSSVGSGCPDLLVGWRGTTHVVEVKDGAKAPSARALTPMEKRWADEWRGSPVVIIESIEDAVKLLVKT